MASSISNRIRIYPRETNKTFFKEIRFRSEIMKLMVTKRRSRLGSARVESFLVIKENKKIVDEFYRKSVKKVKV